MAESTNLGSLGEAKVLIRVDWDQLGSDLDKAKFQVGSAFEKSGKLMRGVGTALTAGLTVPLTGLVTTSTLAASRVNELELVNTQLGKSAGYTEGFIREQEDSVQGMGIEAAASREIIADFIKAELNLADASDVARVAQNAAVISGQNSTETTKTLTQAIITGRSELFKSAGMIVDLNSAYKDYAILTGDATRELTEQEKVQARVNMTLEYGERIAGTYNTAMSDPGKVLRSYPRYLNDISVAFGQNFIPAFEEAIFAGKDFLAWLRDAVSEGGALSPVIEKWGDRFAKAGELVGDFTDKLENMDPVMLQTIANLVAAGAAAGPFLLIGGQLLITIPKLVTGVNAIGKAFGMSAAITASSTLTLGAYAAAIAGLLFLAAKTQGVHKKNRDAIMEEREGIIDMTGSYDNYVNSQDRYLQGLGLRINREGDLVNKMGVVIQENFRLAESEYELEKAQIAVAQSGDEVDQMWQSSIEGAEEATDATDAAAEAALAYQTAMEDTLSFSTNFSRIVSLAQSYDQILGEIGDKQAEINELMEIMDSGGYIDGLWVSAEEASARIQDLQGDIIDLEARMTELANQMVLDMYMATISIDGVTEAEAEAYFRMAADMKIISDEAADKAIEVYGAAIHQINAMKLEDKSATYTTIHRTVYTSEAANAFHWQAQGGYDITSQPTVVGYGEAGTEEAFFVPKGKTIWDVAPASAVMDVLGAERMMKLDQPEAQGGNVIVYATVSNDIDIHKMARKIADEMRRG